MSWCAAVEVVQPVEPEPEPVGKSGQLANSERHKADERRWLDYVGLLKTDNPGLTSDELVIRAFYWTQDEENGVRMRNGNTYGLGTIFASVKRIYNEKRRRKSGFT